MEPPEGSQEPVARGLADQGVGVVQVPDVDAEEVSKPNDRCRGDTDSPFGDLAEEVGRGGEGPPSGGAHGRGGHGVQHAQGPVGGGADTGKPVDRPMALGGIHGEGVVGGKARGAERSACSAGARQQASGVDGMEEVGKGMAAKDADVGSGTLAMHCLTAWGQWAVQLLQCTASLPGGIGQCNFCNALPHCPGAAGSGTPAMHCLIAWEQWAVQLLQCTASLPGGSGQCSFCNALPHCLGAVDSATSAMHYPAASGQWAVDLRQYTAALPGGSGQCNCCNALPHCLGAVGSGTPAMHRFTAWGQWAAQLLQCTGSLPGGSG